MQCDRCGQRPASVFQTIIVNGNKQERHLCEECAHEEGFAGFTQHPFANLSIQQLLSNFLGQEPYAGPAQVFAHPAEPKCRNCGMTYSQFAETGRLGCAQCYDDLESQLLPLVNRIHGTTVHSGKAPKRTGGIVRKRRDLEGLRRQLQGAIQHENYEEAARLRDEIRTMESQLQTGGDGSGVE